MSVRRGVDTEGRIGEKCRPGLAPDAGIMRAMTTQRGFVTVEGTSLYCEVTGSGPAVSLLHGRGADHRMWEEQVPALAARYQVVSYDMRGFGQSPPGENRYAHADDLATLLDELHIDRVVPIGASLGGGAAINFAVLHPQRVRGLVSVDGSLGGFPWSDEFNAFMGRIQRAAVESGVEAAKEMYLGSPIFTQARAIPGAVERLRAILRDYSGWHWFHEDRGRSLEPPAIARLGSIAVPALVIVGEHDVPDFHAIAATLERGIPGARKVVLDGVGHAPNLEAPQRINELVLEFLDALPALGAATDTRGAALHGG
jgi:pimeloyl-ACP methyl ester carboxylesterase